MLTSQWLMPIEWLIISGRLLGMWRAKNKILYHAFLPFVLVYSPYVLFFEIFWVENLWIYWGSQINQTSCWWRCSANCNGRALFTNSKMQAEKAAQVFTTHGCCKSKSTCFVASCASLRACLPQGKMCSSTPRCSDLTSKGVRLGRKRRQEDASNHWRGNLSALEDRFKRRISSPEVK